MGSRGVFCRGRPRLPSPPNRASKACMSSPVASALTAFDRVRQNPTRGLRNHLQTSSLERLGVELHGIKLGDFNA